MTFSVALRCPRTGAIGVAVASSSPAVAARCAHVRAGVGAVLSQNITDPRLGPRGLDRMQAGEAAPDALRHLVTTTPDIAFRQLVLIDGAGRTAVHSGAGSLGVFGASARPGAAVAGNLLASIGVLDHMLQVAARDDAALGDRLIAVMQAGLSAGGEAGPVRSAGMLIAEDMAWPTTDLRVDWHDDPIGELVRLWALWQPQSADFVQRALSPAEAPCFAVPSTSDLQPPAPVTG